MTSNSVVGRPASRRTAVVGLAALVLLAAGVVVLQIVRERRYRPVAPPQATLYLTSPEVVKRLALSFDAIVSDIYWMRAIQFFGGTRLSSARDKNYDVLYPLLDLTTSLDPHFSVPYRFGAYFLSEDPPGGPGRVDLAIRLLEKAMAVHPDRWEYPHDVAFVHYRHRDYARAAEWFERAANTPDAPVWVRPLVAASLAARGDTASARLVWRSLLDSEVEFIRGEATRRLLQLDAIDRVAELERATAEYAARFGAPPRGWQDLMRAGMLQGIPVDPTGRPYVLDPGTGAVDVGTGSPLWPLTMEQPS